MYQLESVDYHRNGVSGEGFHAITFRDTEIGPMMAAVFPYQHRGKNRDNPRVAVFQREQAGAGDLRFGSNSWRGDHYADFLRRAIFLFEFGRRIRTAIRLGNPDMAARRARIAVRLAHQLGVN